MGSHLRENELDRENESVEAAWNGAPAGRDSPRRRWSLEWRHASECRIATSSWISRESLFDVESLDGVLRRRNCPRVPRLAARTAGAGEAYASMGRLQEFAEEFRMAERGFKAAGKAGTSIGDDQGLV